MPSPNIFFVKHNEIFHRVPLATIQYLEADGNYTNIQTTDKRFLVKISLTKVSEELSSPNFIKIHKTFIINIELLPLIDFSNNLIMGFDKPLPISRTYKKNLTEAIKTLY